MQKAEEPVEMVNVFLGRKGDDDLVKEVSVSERYIIEQNTRLLEENRSLCILKTELSSRVEELEGIEDRADARSSNLKGLLKNFHEVSKWQTQIDKKQRSIILSTNEVVNAFTKEIRTLAHILYALLIIFVMLCVKLFNTVPSFFVAIVVVTFQECYLMNFPVLSYDALDVEIKELRKKVEEADKANDYIHEFLDSQ